MTIIVDIVYCGIMAQSYDSTLLPEIYMIGAVRGNHLEEPHAMTSSKRDHQQVQNRTKTLSPLNVADTYVEKGIVTALIAIDTISHISPFRWVSYLSGCEDDDSSSGSESADDLDPIGGTGNPSGGCTKDTDCREPRICEGGKCVFPPNMEENNPDGGTMSPNEIEMCKPGETRACGPCEIATQMCGTDHFWEAACLYSQDLLVETCYTGPEGTLGVGECQEGARNCFSGTWGACEDDVKPNENETCNGKDDDCDGLTDEDLREVICGLGPCEHTAENCINGGLQACNPFEGATSEICDGVDNDCDGDIDEEACGSRIGDPCYPDYPEGANEEGRAESIFVSSDCESGFCVPPLFYERGYCSDYPTFLFHDECLPGHDFRLAVCVVNSQLGVSSHPDFFRGEYVQYCVVTCELNSDCRTEEGYRCKTIDESSLKACLPQNEIVTIGEGACSH